MSDIRILQEDALRARVALDAKAIEVVEEAFATLALGGVEMPPPTNPDRVLGLPLRDGAWDGITGQVLRDL